jgi:excisionase family DNA binding protein
MPEDEITMTRLNKIRELAEAAGLNVMTLYRAICRGDLEAVRLGPRSLRVSDDAFRRYLRPVHPEEKTK